MATSGRILNIAEDISKTFPFSTQMYPFLYSARYQPLEIFRIGWHREKLDW